MASCQTERGRTGHSHLVFPILPGQRPAYNVEQPQVSTESEPVMASG